MLETQKFQMLQTLQIEKPQLTGERQKRQISQIFIKPQVKRLITRRSLVQIQPPRP